MKSKDREAEITFSGKTKDVGFIVEILRRDGISFRQVLAFNRAPIIAVPAAYEAQLKKILATHSANRRLEIIAPERLQGFQQVFWIMVAGGIGILSIAWVRVLIHRHH